MTENLQEFVSAGANCRVDRHGAVVGNVKIIGLESKNGRRYLPEGLRRAIPLYEAAKVFVDHPTGSPTSPRSYADRLGSLHNVSIDASGLIGDLHYNPKHPIAEQLAWDAEHAPENVGLSHNVKARTSRKDGKVIVEEIIRVHSVDLVADPATSRGLFESANRDESAAGYADTAEDFVRAITGEPPAAARAEFRDGMDIPSRDGGESTFTREVLQ
jgi:hypothetical protein